MQREYGKIFFGGALFAVVALSGFVIYSLTRPPPQAPLPNPNGYDDFVKAGEMIGQRFANHANFSEEKLRSALAANAEALALARRGLTRKCQVEIRYTAEFYRIVKARRFALMELGHALAAEGRLAEMEMRASDAFKIYLDCIRLGNQCGRGGLALDETVGWANEQTGIKAMQRMINDFLAHDLSLAECREGIRTLEAGEANKDAEADIMEREETWWRRQLSPVAYCRWTISEMVRQRTFHPRNPTKATVGMVEAGIRSERGRLLVDLAGRAYKLEKGDYPDNLTELVPAYLKMIPVDPGTGSNMVYWPPRRPF